MARIRSIKPEFWKHEELSELPEATHLLAAQLLNYVDDEGLFNANPKLIKAEVSPLREPSVSIHDSLKSLSEIGYISLGTGSDGRRYGRVVTFTKHQRINRPTPSKISEMEITWDASPQPHGQLTEPSLPERKGEEGNRELGVEEVGKGGAGGKPNEAPAAPSDAAPTKPSEVLAGRKPGERQVEPIPDKFLRPKKPARKTRLDAEFVIEIGDERHRYAHDLGMTDDAMEIECDKFENHHKAKGNLMADWDAAWRTWCRNWQTFSQQRRA